MSPLVYVTRAGVVIAALRRSPPWVTVEADLLAIDHVRDAVMPTSGTARATKMEISQMRSFLVTEAPYVAVIGVSGSL
jgi:hypothetical protein